MTSYNMVSERSNKPVVNQVVVEDHDSSMFFSYGKPIVKIDRDKTAITVGDYYDYSATTGRYRNKFLHDQGCQEIASLPSLRAQLEVGSVFINDTLFTVEHGDF